MGFWYALLILLLINACGVYGKLTGDHICLTEKLYLANVTEPYLKNITIRNYQWCLNFPPRCSFYTTKLVSATRIVEKNQTKVVEECCINFVNKDDHCVSSCPSCINGICERGRCNCLAGFKGNSCELECTAGEWGPNCSRTCECTSHTCDSITGVCIEPSTSTIKVTSTSTSTTKVTTVPTVTTTPTSLVVPRVTKVTIVSTVSTIPTVPSLTQVTTVPTIPTVPRVTEVITVPTIPTVLKVKQVPTVPTVPMRTVSTMAITTTEPSVLIEAEIPVMTTKSTNQQSEQDSRIESTISWLHKTTEKSTDVNHVNKTEYFESIPEIPPSISNTSGTTPSSITSNVPTVAAVTKSVTKLTDQDVVSGSPAVTDKTKYTTRTFSNGSIATNDGLLIPVEIEYGRLKSDVQEKNDIKSVGKEDYLNREMSDNKVSFNDFALFGITVLLALMIVVVILVVNILRKRKVEQSLKTENGHQVAVFSATIYHSAVPEIVEYEYDHPPSSNYRTTSVFRTDEATNETTSDYQPEPIYDEIPNKAFEPSTSNIPPTSIYINTCESTKF